MKPKSLLTALSLICGIFLLFIVGCKKNDSPAPPVVTLVAPTLTTTSASLITQTTMQGGGSISSDGGASVTVRGICWATTANPTIANSKTTDGTGTGSFTSSLTGLTANTVYYVKAYATNSVGTGYGSEITFTTLQVPVAPVLAATTAAGSIAQTTAQSGGSVTSDGGAAVTARGICWATTTNPSILNSKTTDGTGTGVFTSSLTGLTANTTYYAKAYATNSVGTSYGTEISFTTLKIPTLPVLAATTVASLVVQTTAQSGGSVTSDGNAAITARGVCWSTTTNPTTANSKTTDGTGIGIFTSSLTGLTANTLYYARAYATNSVGTSYGSEITFTTLPLPVTPTLTTNAYSFVAVNNVNSGGSSIFDGYAPITVKGVCYGTATNPTIADTRTSDGTGTGNFTSSLTSLNPGTYYARAYATNGANLTGYGNQITFTVYAIGQNYGGGIIFYIDGTFQHGLITSKTDLTDANVAPMDWSNGTDISTFANGTAIGTGLANTNTIVAAQGSGTYPAKVCKNYLSGGFNDWYLPSKDELNQLYINKNTVGTFGGITTYSYWSSSEVSTTKAWSQSFQSGTQNSVNKSGFGAPWTRAIRAF